MVLLNASATQASGRRSRKYLPTSRGDQPAPSAAKLRGKTTLRNDRGFRPRAETKASAAARACCELIAKRGLSPSFVTGTSMASTPAASSATRSEERRVGK